MVKGSAGGANLALTIQLADEDFANALDDVSNYTFAGSFSDAYAVANLGDDGDSSPFFVTLGYTYNIGPASLVYFELQNIDNDVDNQDAQTIVRSTFKYDFGS